ncbi:MAG TPA: arylesterase [Candidatus Omnitrophota bacterium]|nr:arylesterase [Candidatus Omnitrophota bacterium]
MKPQKKIIPFCIFIPLFILSSCSNEPKLNSLASGDKILAFGDSITAGTGANPGQDYPSVLESLIERKIINAGVRGETTAEGVRRLPEWIDRHQPALLLLCEGGNDFLQKRPPEEIEKNLERMIEIAKEKKIQVVLIAVPKFGLILLPDPLYRRIAKKHSIPCEEKTLSRILSSPLFKADQIHPNEKGYRTLAESLAFLLKKSGAV